MKIKLIYCNGWFHNFRNPYEEITEIDEKGIKVTKKYLANHNKCCHALKHNDTEFRMMVVEDERFNVAINELYDYLKTLIHHEIYHVCDGDFLTIKFVLDDKKIKLNFAICAYDDIRKNLKSLFKKLLTEDLPFPSFIY